MCRWRRGLFCITSRSTRDEEWPQSNQRVAADDADYADLRKSEPTQLGGHIDVFGRVGVALLLGFLFVRWLALGLIGVAAVAAGVEGVGGFDLMLERVTGEACV